MTAARRIWSSLVSFIVIWIKQFSRLYYFQRFWTIFRGCKMRLINGVYLLYFYLLTEMEVWLLCNQIETCFSLQHVNPNLKRSTKILYQW